MKNIINDAWQIYQRFERESDIINPSMPILYLGNLESYQKSAIRVITLGLNPLPLEFPARNRFARFRAVERIYPTIAQGHHHDTFLEAQNDYFRLLPNRHWFNVGYEPILKGMETSYYGNEPATALHTYLCSPLATSRLWHRLPQKTQVSLTTPGIPLWHRLIEVLQPDVILVSLIKNYLNLIQFPPLSSSEAIFTIQQRSDGSPSKKPYTVSAWRIQLGSRPAAIVFGNAAETPFGSAAMSIRSSIGQAIRDYLQRDP